MPDKGYHRKSNGEGSIFQRSDGRWCAQIQIGTLENGKPKYKLFYGMKEKTVRDRLKTYKQTMSQSDYNPDSKSITIDEFISAWLTTVKSNELKPTSYDRLERTINNQIIPMIGHYELTKISSQQIQNELINPLKGDKSYSTIKKAYNAINACYKYALIIRKISFNPVDAVVIPSITQFDKTEIHWFDDDEIAKFKLECGFRYSTGSYKHCLGYGFVFILNTGLRLGEAIAIKWSDINFTTNQLFVEQNAVTVIDRSKNAKSKHILVNQDFLKTKSSRRIIPLNKTALDSLSKIKSTRYFGDNSYILCQADGSQNTTQNFMRQYKSVIHCAGIKNCGLHTLRHTFASKLFEKNVDIKIISSLLGHADVSITYNTYIHLIQKQRSNAVQSIDEI